ncbi:MAG: PadR family transcriptional regulator [Candidatus Bathyarchaeota archaeon]|jgi:DNA-binding PadR family transcriptional regulator|nr:PadR family transcriptional regulator [Candidatus Bathyarchaeota archaeon]
MESINLNEAFIKNMERRFVKSFLDLFILKLIQSEPMWGYKILKKTEALYQIKLRHGALYPLLNALEANGFIKSKQELQKGRIRKVYQITPKGTQFIKTYQNFLKQQLQKPKSKTKEKNK